MLQRIRSGEIRNVKDAREAGFTLIELLIVIVVLGVLAGIVVFGVAKFRDDSVTAACKADVKTVSVAVDAYRAAKGTYPTGATSADRMDLLTAAPGYLKAAPSNPEYTISITDNAGTVDGSAPGC